MSEHSLENLDEYEYVWLTFVFNKNVGKKKNISGTGGHTRRAKVFAPKNDSKKRVGVFSTRSPHRPNAIGQTLARIELVKKNVLYLTGIDLVDGTPILDIKPYVPHYDSIPGAKVPAWVSKAFHSPRLDVVFSSKARESIHRCVRFCEFYNDSEELSKALTQVIAQDMRSGNTRRRHGRRDDVPATVAKKTETFCFSFDGLRVMCEAETPGVVCVRDVSSRRGDLGDERECEGRSKETPSGE